MYTVEIKQNGVLVEPVTNLIYGDSMVIEVPGFILSGKVKVLEWKIRKLNEANAKLNKMLAEEREQVNLSYVSDDKLYQELGKRLDLSVAMRIEQHV